MKDDRTLTIITGCNGHTGGHLCRYLRESGEEGVILGVDTAPAPVHGVDVYVRNVSEDALTDALRIRAGKARRTVCFHAAGLMRGRTFSDLLRNNLGVSAVLMEALAPFGDRVRFVNIGSSAEYGYAGRTAVSEDRAASPVSAYGVCKTLQTNLVRSCSEIHGLDTVMTRTFNITGPGQTDDLACGNMVRQAVGYLEGRVKKIKVLSLDAYRDLVDIRDAVRAYALIAEKGRSGEVYNVASGRAVRMSAVLDSVLRICGLDRGAVEEEPSAPAGVPYQKASIERISRVTGWRPRYSLERTLRDMIEHEKGRPGRRGKTGGDDS